MKDFIIYLLESSICISIFYLLYILLLKNDTFFRLNRLFIVAGLVLSFVIPLINLGISLSNPLTLLSQKNNNATTEIYNTELDTQDESIPVSMELQEKKEQKSTLYFILMGLFIAGFSYSLAKLFRQIFLIIALYKKGKKITNNNIMMIHIEQDHSPFSIFNLIFINPSGISASEENNIIAHERVHFQQMHTLDNIVLEILALIQWFNPCFWGLANALRNTHEYLADEGVLEQGISRTSYQVLMLNQVVGGHLLGLTSNLNFSFTKKRLIMMTKAKSPTWARWKILGIVPVAMVLGLIFSCNAQKKADEKLAVVSPTKMNVMYIGVDNPCNIAVAEEKSEDIMVEVDNGTISGKNGVYIVNPKKPGSLNVSVFLSKGNKKELIRQFEFRVKTIPDPRPSVAGKSWGKIKKEDLLSAKTVDVSIPNFDFDLPFEVVEFTVTTTQSGSVYEAKAEGNTFNWKQIKILKELKEGQNVYIQDIKAKGPDGAIRMMPTLKFTIEG